MSNYKAEVTLNEKDSLTDLLSAEKSLVKLYALCITEGCSQGFRSVVKRHLSECITNQMDAFLLLTELGYYRVESAEEESLKKIKDNFSGKRQQLS